MKPDFFTITRTMPWSRRIKVFQLVLSGIACLAMGWIGSYWFSIVKWLFSSTFVLWACGQSYLLLALFYTAIDIFGLRRRAFPDARWLHGHVEGLYLLYRNKQFFRV